MDFLSNHDLWDTLYLMRLLFLNILQIECVTLECEEQSVKKGKVNKPLTVAL